MYLCVCSGEWGPQESWSMTAEAFECLVGYLRALSIPLFSQYIFQNSVPDYCRHHLVPPKKPTTEMFLETALFLIVKDVNISRLSKDNVGSNFFLLEIRKSAVSHKANKPYVILPRTFFLKLQECPSITCSEIVLFCRRIAFLKYCSFMKI